MMELIDRDVLIEELDWLHGVVDPTSKPSVKEMIERVKEQPTVDAAPVVHGEWINVVGGFFELGRCSVCGGQWPTAGGLNFCPNCGAKMDGGEERG